MIAFCEHLLICAIPLLSAGRRDLASYQIFKKEGSRQDLTFERGLLGKKDGGFFQGDCSFYIKVNLKHLMEKKVYKQKMFFSVLTKNLNWEILSKISLVLNDGMELGMKIFNIMWVH